MLSIIFAIISGISMTMQGVFNTRLSEKLGIWQTNVLVQSIALVTTLIVAFFLSETNYKGLKDINKLYLVGGFLGVVITFTVMKSIGNLGPTFGIAIILIAQLISAAIIDAFGLFNTQKTPFEIKQIIGVIVMICGIIIIKWKQH